MIQGSPFLPQIFPPLPPLLHSPQEKSKYYRMRHCVWTISFKFNFFLAPEMLCTVTADDIDITHVIQCHSYILLCTVPREF